MVWPELSRIPKNFSTTSTKVCGRTTTSWRQMSFKPFQLLIAVTCVVSAMSVTGYSQSNSLLADRIEAGDRKAALEMIGRNSPVNAAQPDGSTPLHWAVYRVDDELVKTLLARGAKADVVNAYGSSPLSEATRVANANLVAMLLDAGA